MSSDEQTRKDLLRRYLDSARTSVLWKAEGLDERTLRQPMTPTGSTILGIIQHLAFTEFGYFSYCMKRPVHNPRAVQLFTQEDPLADFVVEAELSSEDVLQFYRESIAAADTAFDELPLDAPAHVPWWGDNAQTTMEHLMVHMISETARHAGHLDLLRELSDGAVGLSKEKNNLPQLDAEDWKKHFDRLQAIADSM